MAQLLQLPHLIAVKHKTGTVYLHLEDIVYLKGADKTTTLFAINPLCKEGFSQYIKTINLGSFEYLEQFGFIRVNQTFIINSLYLRELSNEKYIQLHCHWQHESIVLTPTFKQQLNRLTQKPEINA